MKRVNPAALKARLSRRQILAAAGGITVGLPLMRSLQAKADSKAPPKRLLLMYTANGMIHDAWFPTGAGETDFTLGAIQQPLEPFKNRLLLFSGVDLNVALEGIGGPHQRGIGGLFTNQTLQEGTSFVDGCGRTSGWANGASIDQEVAKQIGQDTLFPSLELGVRALDNDVQGRIAYAGAGRPLPPMNDPRAIFDRLFTSVGGSGSSSATEEVLLRRRSVLDTVRGQFASLNKQLSSEDRVISEAHLELVRDVERRMTSGATSKGPFAVQACEAPLRPEALEMASETDMPQIADLELDLLAMAFACDLTRVGSFMISTALNRIRYPFVNSMNEGHNLSHSGPSDAEAKAERIRRQTWEAERLAHLLTRLASFTEADGTSVLDNTLVLWGTDVSRGDSHSHLSMPFLMVGGGWYFRTGRHLKYMNASHGDLLVSVLNAFGVPTQSFGVPEYSTGPLPGLV